MTLENHESIKTDEGQKEGHSLNKSRRAFTKAGVSVPVVMTLTSKTALGGIYECSISGKLSGNTSNEATSPPSCGVGFSPGGWKENAIKTVNQDGNINHWCLAGVNPFSIRTSSGAPEIRYLGVWKPAVDASRGLKLKTVYDKILAKFGAGAEATKFSSIFGGSAEYVWDVLNATSPPSRTWSHRAWLQC